MRMFRFALAGALPAFVLLACIQLDTRAASTLPPEMPSWFTGDDTLNDHIWQPVGTLYTGATYVTAKFATASQSRQLFFEDRVAYQRAIEEVYWRHRIWPKNRPDRKPSLDAVMSQATIEQKAKDYLRNSELLEEEWQKPITPEQLQAEMERMAQHTKQPEVLRELFAALGNDPFVIAECLARPVLSERLQFAAVEWDKEPLESWSAKAQNQLPNVMAAATANYALPAISDQPSDCIDSWTATSTINAPTDRRQHTAVWTGTEMIVWGGLDSSSNYLNTGGRYNPVTDGWTATSTTNAPDGRWFHTAVWTGTEMIVWGGSPGSLNTGGKYNPATDSWTATSTINAPTGRFVHTAVWTGTEMIVWGGTDNGANAFNTGGRYNPGTDSWTATSTTKVPGGRFDHTAVWTGTEMIVWGGFQGGNFLSNGGRYNPGSDNWTATSTTNAPSTRSSPTAVWTGSEMIVWGGANLTGLLNTGGRYNPGTDGWTATSTTNVPTGRYLHSAVWTSSEMIVWGGTDSNNYFSSGGRYNPGTDSWTATTTTNAPTGRYLHTAAWTGSEMIVWGGAKIFDSFDTGGRYCAQPGGGELTLVSAASSKKQGNAGAFDIDLPLSGIPGGECRQGALGTATSIVFTFSDTVNSVDSTSTTCGRVISTTADGSAVTVLLKDIQTTCDGSDVTVTLTGVNGDSGTLASAAVTFGQLAGDVNGDGTVDASDLQSVRSNSGPGLVTEANFHNDVSGDGKVNHADISLTRAARGNSLP